MGDSFRIAVVDDVAAVRNSIRALLETYGFTVEIFESVEAFFAFDPKCELGCVLFDVRMPGMSGLEAQKLLARKSPGLSVIIITGHGDIDMAVRAMKEGAFDFIEKPIDDEKLVSSVGLAINHQRNAGG